MAAECYTIRERILQDGIFCRGRELSTYDGEQEVNFRPRLSYSFGDN
jgi:hypothetical protein